MLVKAANGLAEQIGRRDVSGEQQQRREADHVLHAQVLTIDLGGQQIAHHVLAWRTLALLEHLAEVVRHLLKGVREALELWVLALLLCNSGDPASQPIDGTRRESMRDQAAILAMLRRVHRDNTSASARPTVVG